MRQYRAGFKMKYLIVAIYDGSPTCQNQTLTRHGLLPTERRQTAFLIETYANRGKVTSRG